MYNLTTVLIVGVLLTMYMLKLESIYAVLMDTCS